MIVVEISAGNREDPQSQHRSWLRFWNACGSTFCRVLPSWDLNTLGEELAEKRKAKPAFTGYHGYPFALCTSINEEVVHGMPSRQRHLKEGDIISLDFGVVYEGYFGDAAITVPVGRISEEAHTRVPTATLAAYQRTRPV